MCVCVCDVDFIIQPRQCMCAYACASVCVCVCVCVCVTGLRGRVRVMCEQDDAAGVVGAPDITMVAGCVAGLGALGGG